MITHSPNAAVISSTTRIALEARLTEKKREASRSGYRVGSRNVIVLSPFFRL